MKAETHIIKCVVCGEDTTHDIESSFYGSVHRWGPTDHKFEPDARPVPQRTEREDK